MGEKIRVGVLVENHPYDVIGFQKMLESFADCECYVQPVDLFVRDVDGNQLCYDTLVYYNIDCDAPEEGSPLRLYLENEAGKTRQGILVLHHALLNWREWDVYTDITGIRQRGEGGLFKYTQNETVRSHIADKSHPITAGVDDFTITDETYIIGEPEEAGNHILITTDNKMSIDNIAWTRQYKNSRVFSYASGHDNRVYSDKNFRTILHNAIQWTANRI